MRTTVIVLCACGVALAQPKTGPCVTVGKIRPLDGVHEASGVAEGRSLWAINDSGNPPVLYRFGATGGASRVTVTGATLVDWEDLAIGRCGDGDCLYIGDIGDNQARRGEIIVYRVREPGAAATSTGRAEAFPLAYPDRPYDAEALLVTPAPVPDVFIITKASPPRVYRLPPTALVSEGALRRPRTVLSFVRTLNLNDQITGAAASRDGRWVALRSYRRLYVYSAAGFAAGTAPIDIDLSGFAEPQGEGVGFGPANELYLVSEARNKRAAGILTRLRCDFAK